MRLFNFLNKRSNFSKTIRSSGFYGAAVAARELAHELDMTADEKAFADESAVC
jgi:hypothetical protein